MRKLKFRFMPLFLAFLLVLLPSVARADDAEEHFSYYNEVPIMLIGDFESGKILFEKNIDDPHAVASMAKLMTYYVVKKAIAAGEINELDQVIVSERAAALNTPEYSSYGLKVGEHLSVADLLKGLIVVSGNDAAVALAEHTAGSVEKFVKRMNDTAQELGLEHTHFVNPHGITEEDGSMDTMSARDLFELSRHIIREFPEVLDYGHITQIDEPARGFQEDSTFAGAVGDIRGLDGLKTGTTDAAGYCFTGTVDMSKIDSSLKFRIITVVMGCETDEMRWRTTKEMVDYTAGTFREATLVNKDYPIMQYKLPSSQEEYVTLYPKFSYSTITFQSAMFDIRYEIDKNIEAPTKEGQSFGEILIYRQGKPVEKIPIVAHEPTTRAGRGVRIQRAFESLINFLAELLA